MPVYEYRCQGCQTKFELRRSFGQADSPTNCPHCESDQVRRLLSMFASYSKGEGGVSTPVAGGGGGCSGCSSGSCASCGH